jgi:hypothetical protein
MPHRTSGSVVPLRPFLEREPTVLPSSNSLHGTRTRKLVNPDSLKSREKFLAFRVLVDCDGMIRGGFLSAQDRWTLIALARDGSAASRLTRCANALVLLDDGWSCQEVADALLLNDDTIRNWHKLFERRGIEGLTSFDMGGSASF